MKVSDKVLRQPRTKGRALFLEVLRSPQIGLPHESIDICDLQDKGSARGVYSLANYTAVYIETYLNLINL